MCGRIKKGIMSFNIIFLLITAGFTGLLVFEGVVDECGVAAMTTRYVGGSGAGNWSKIQDAIDNASAGDTIRVYAGTYYENVLVNKTLNIIGNGSANTTINGGGSGDVVEITSDWVNVTGFTMTNSGSSWDDAGIEIVSSKNCKIKNIKAKNNVFGIWLYYSLNNTLENNNCSNNYCGINLEFSSNNKIIGNDVSMTDYGIMIVTSSDNNEISFNTLTDCLEGIVIIISSEAEIIGNVIDQQFPNILRHYGIRIRNCNNINVEENNISYYSLEGIRLYGSDNCTLYNNNITYCEDGINILSMSENIRVIGNNVKLNDGTGIKISASDGNYISLNRIINNNDHGILLETSKNNIVGNNNISHNGDKFHSDCGIKLKLGSSKNNIRDNQIYANKNGMNLYFSQNNTIENNIISHSYWEGITISESMGTNVKANKIFHNQFYGIKVSDSSLDLTIMGNIVSYQAWEGIYVESDDARVIANIASHNGDCGIYVDSNNSHVMGNIASQNGGGIYVKVDNAMVIDNNASHNEYGGIYCKGNNNKISRNYANENNGTGIWISGEYCIINDNSAILNNHSGIYMEKANENKISSNNFSYNNFSGIHIEHSKNNEELEKNPIDSNVLIENGIAIHFGNDRYYSLTGNKMVGSGIWINDLENEDSSVYNIDDTNTVNGKPVYYWYGKQNVTVPEDAAQVFVHNCDGTVIRNLELSECTVGIEAANCRGTTIENNSISSVTHNGIKVDSSNNTKIQNNTVSDIGNAGIDYDDCSGIYIDGGVENTVLENHLIQNKLGVLIVNSDYSKVYHNNFIDNSKQADCYGFISWDKMDWYISWNQEYPIGGNYWSDLASKQGIDKFRGRQQDQPGGDGLVDTPYIINDDWLNKFIDDYPLMEPFTKGVMPSVPINVKVERRNYSLFLTWNDPEITGGSKLMSYKIYKGRNTNETEDIYYVDGLLNYTDENVHSGCKYYYRVSAINHWGEGPKSDEIEIVPGKVPSMPSDFEVNATSDHIELSWGYPEFDDGHWVVNFKLYKTTIPGEFQEYMLLDEYHDGYDDYDVHKGIPYYYRISAITSVGEGELSDELNTTIFTFPSPPLNLSVKAGDAYVNLSWEPPAFQGGTPVLLYHVYRNDTSNKFKKLGKTNSDTLFLNDTGLTNGIPYSYRVSAMNEVGNSNFTAIINATPIDPNFGNKPPLAFIYSENTTGPAPLTIAFFGYGIDSDGTIVSYRWDFDDGNESTEKDPVHTFIVPRTYYVKLWVHDNAGKTGMTMVTVVVEPEPIDIEPDEDQDDGASALVGGLIILIIIIEVILVVIWMLIKKKGEKKKLATAVYAQPPPSEEAPPEKPTEQPPTQPPPEEMPVDQPTPGVSPEEIPPEIAMDKPHTKVPPEKITEEQSPEVLTGTTETTEIMNLTSQGDSAYSEGRYTDAILAWQQVLEKEPGEHPDIEMAIKDAMRKINGGVDNE